MKPISLFGTGIKSLAATITAQRRLNCFYDIRQDGDKSNIIIRGTPGSSVAFTLPDSPIRGWRVVGTLLYVVAGAHIYTVTFGGVITNLGAIINSGQYVSMTDDAVHLLIVDGQQGYTIALPSGPPILIADANFPNGATTCDTLDSRAIVEYPSTNRQFYVSSLLDSSTWTPQIFGTKENTADQLIAVNVLNGVLILWGLQSIEFWQDVGSTPLPYQRINGATQTWGLAAKLSRAYLNNSMVFLAQNPQGGVQVMKLSGYTPVPISNSDINNIISNFAIYSDAVALTYMVDGHPMYQLTFPNANRSFLYDDSTNFWYETQTGVALINRHFGNLGVTFNTKNYVSDLTTGNIYLLDTDLTTDNSVAIKRQVVSKHIRVGGNDFGISEVTIEMETGVGTDTGQGSDPRLMMRVSRDGGRTFGAERWAKIGRGGEYKRRVHYSQLGSARDFVMEFTMTDPVPFVITLGEAVVSPGTETQQ